MDHYYHYYFIISFRWLLPRNIICINYFLLYNRKWNNHIKLEWKKVMKKRYNSKLCTVKTLSIILFLIFPWKVILRNLYFIIKINLTNCWTKEVISKVFLFILQPVQKSSAWRCIFAGLPQTEMTIPVRGDPWASDSRASSIENFTVSSLATFIRERNNVSLGRSQCPLSGPRPLSLRKDDDHARIK